MAHAKEYRVQGCSLTERQVGYGCSDSDQCVEQRTWRRCPLPDVGDVTPKGEGAQPWRRGTHAHGQSKHAKQSDGGTPSMCRGRRAMSEGPVWGPARGIATPRTGAHDCSMKGEPCSSCRCSVWTTTPRVLHPGAVAPLHTQRGGTGTGVVSWASWALGFTAEEQG
jgi:hypothetical protein